MDIISRYGLHLCCLCFCCLSTTSEGQVQVVAPMSRIHAVAGGDVILPCFLKPTMNAASHTVEWLRPDLKPKEAHCYRDHRDSEEDQNPSYKGRTSLFKEELKNGNVSLKLTGVTLSDAGNYTCFIPTVSSTQRPVVQLLVVLLSTLVYCSLGQGGASLSITPDRSQFFKYESVSLSCEVQGNSAGWRVVRNAEKGILSECNTTWGKQQGSSCIVPLIPSDSGLYWCVSGSGEHSNAVNITVPAGAVILESPALPVTEGDSVTLRCRYQGTPSDLTTDFYKDGSLIRTETTGEMTIPAVSKSDEGLYKCTNSEGESPESWMTVTDLSLPASLSVSPDRYQFFEYESVSLSCEVQGNSTGWRVVRNAERGILSECNTDWGKQQGSSCIVSLKPSDSGVYWCESGSGEHSNAVNITVHAPIPSPAVPVLSMSVPRLLCSLLVGSPYLLVTIILLVKYCRSRAQVTLFIRTSWWVEKDALFSSGE